MGHAPTAVLVAVALALLTPPPASGTFTGAFVPLRDHLAERGDALSAAGPRGRAAARQRKALRRSLGLLDREAPGLLQDLRTAGRVSRILARVFPGEGRRTPAPPLDGILAALLADLQGAVHGEVRDLAGSLPGRDPATAAAVGRHLDRAEAALRGADDGDPVAWAKALCRAQRLVDRASRDLGTAGPPARSWSCTVDGLAADLDTVDVVYSTSTGSLTMAAARVVPPTRMLTLLPGGPVLGPGVFPLATASYVEQSGTPTHYVAAGGHLEVHALDVPGGIVSFTAAFTASGEGATSGSVEVSFSYEGPFFRGD